MASFQFGPNLIKHSSSRLVGARALPLLLSSILPFATSRDALVGSAAGRSLLLYAASKGYHRSFYKAGKSPWMLTLKHLLRLCTRIR
ncbi:hypothetical protein K402DRAFT_172818 [Aulographum hederae CBS 113979]|uniref:Uncharacterized protein n=1 Tax=Aulographum hederae CBS 113979 TaxID=1176131 RepID=A0A6G1HDF5_9PEZI|nr:hypothetical protein K402DRAFT_172818 [Aulographum hederae CBS 113979]